MFGGVLGDFGAPSRRQVFDLIRDLFHSKRGARIPPGLFNVLSLVVVVRPLGRRPLDRKSNKSSIENYTEINDEMNPK